MIAILTAEISKRRDKLQGKMEHQLSKKEFEESRNREEKAETA